MLVAPPVGVGGTVVEGRESGLSGVVGDLGRDGVVSEGGDGVVAEGGDGGGEPPGVVLVGVTLIANFMP